MKVRGRRFRGLFLICGALAVLGMAQMALAARGVDSSSTKRVSIRDNAFGPKRLTIRSGDTVRWTWRKDVETDHNVRFRKLPKGVSAKPGSPTKASGTFSRKFRKRGTYRYVCTIHQALGMTGTITVK